MKKILVLSTFMFFFACGAFAQAQKIRRAKVSFFRPFFNFKAIVVIFYIGAPLKPSNSPQLLNFGTPIEYRK